MKKGFLFFLALITALPITIGAGPASVAYARGCGANSYINSRGNCVHRPVRSNKAPAGASARCRDGTYSFSQSRRGTCSHHGGVATWL